MPTYNELLKKINRSVSRFRRGVPASQKAMFDALDYELGRLDLYADGNIRATAKNMGILSSIRNKMLRLMMTDEYRSSVKEFIGEFNELTKLMNSYWKEQESGFTPRALLKEIRKDSVNNVARMLTEAGIGVNVGDKIVEILRANITTGGSYRDLKAQLREGLLNTEQKGYLDKYAGQVAKDAMNQYAAQYNEVVSSDLGYEWFKYANTDIETTRPFCDAMTDQPYFHVSEIPRLLRAEGLYYTKDGVLTKVPIYERTGLPHGLIPGTNAENFRVRRGGYNCGHQVRPVHQSQVPPEVVLAVQATPAYKKWKKAVKNTEDTDEEFKKSVDSLIARESDSLKAFTRPGGELLPQRQELHRSIVNEITSKKSTSEGTIYMLGGAPANGKSTLVKSGKLPHPEGIEVLDVDAVKSKIPEYVRMNNMKDPRAANFVHEESSVIGKQVVNEMLKKNKDFVVDGVGDGEFDGLMRKITTYRSTGKKVRADYVTLDLDLAIKLQRIRAEATGRYVPESYLRKMDREIAKLVPKLVEAKAVDELYLWDTNINGQARLVISLKNGIFKVHDKELYANFLKKGR